MEDRELSRNESFIARMSDLDLKDRTVQMEIDGLVYTSTKLTARQGLEIYPRLLSLLGAGLADAILSGTGGGLELRHFVPVAKKIMDDGLWPLVRGLTAQLRCSEVRGTGEGGRITPELFDDHFAGEYTHLLWVCVFLCRHNFMGPTLGGG